MSETILIDGIMGQDGSYLAKHLLDAGESLIGVTRRSGSSTSSQEFYRPNEVNELLGDSTKAEKRIRMETRIQY